MRLHLKKLFFPVSIHSPGGLPGLARRCYRALGLCFAVTWQFVGIPHASAQALTPGSVVSWGYNGHGQTSISTGLSSVTAIATGDSHTLALKSDGMVVSWGYNGNGQTNVPADLSGVKSIAGGNYHSLTLKGDGTVVSWGYGDFGQTSIPAGLSGITAIAVGAFHSVAGNTTPVDTTAPAVTMVAPTQNARYFIKQSVPASYACTDPSTVTLCAGSLPVGALIDTARMGAYTFIVTATDGRGNTGSTFVNYTVEAGPAMQSVKPVKGK